MSYDAHSNFGYSTVATAPSPATSGTTLTVATGQGALFPAAPFNCTVWPTAVDSVSTNSEIIRVTSKGSGDDWTIVRTQESTSARTIIVGDQIANTTSVKVFTDIEAAADAAAAAAAAITKTSIGLGNVTNDAQTKAAIVPNTAPSAGQVLVGNAGGTAYAPVSLSGKVTITSAGVASVSLASGDIPNNAANTSGNAATVTTNANLTGDVTSVGNAATLAAGSASVLNSGTLPTGRMPALTGDVTTSAGAVATTIKTDVALAGNPTTTTQTAGDSSTKLATTAFVATAVLQGPAKEAVKYASVAALPSIVYANGSSGVGATLTGVALAAISLDSSSPAVADRVLIKNQASTFQNGIYVVTATGSGIAVFVLTRATDFDQSGDIKTGASTYITSGSTLAGTTFDVNSADSPVMGTDAITFTQTAGPGSVTSGNGITVTGASVAIDTSVTVDKTTAQTLTNKTLTSPTFTAPALGAIASGNLAAGTADGTNAIGFLGIPQNSKSANYTIVAADNGKHIYHPSADTTARTITIDSNANLALGLGFTFTIVNDSSAGVLTIAITSDTLVLAGAGTTGARTLAANGIATAIKMTSTRWQINGTGLT